MKGTLLLTDKDHIKSKYEVFTALDVAGADRLLLSEQATSDFMGFGVAITGSSCYQLNLMQEDERDALLRSIYSPDGLNLSIGRISVGSSDYSPELYSYDDTPFDTELKNFSIERDKAYILPMLRKILKIRPDLYLFASPWSPPYWMKTGGNMCGGFMREQFVECYADYIIKFLKAYEEAGIHISAITPQNEPQTQQKGMMPACIWHPETEARFIKCLKEKLQKNDLDVKIWMWDYNFADADRVLWNLDNLIGLKEACDGVAFHYYLGAIEETLKIKGRFPSLPLHFTEAGPRLYDHYGDDWCKWGIMISKAIGSGYSSFTGWNLLLNEIGGPNIGPFFCGGLLTRDSRTGEISYSGQYKALSHISPYLKKGTRLFPLIPEKSISPCMSVYPKKTFPVEGFAFENADGKIGLVLINQNTEKKQVKIMVKENFWYFELMPESINTAFLEE